MSPDNRPGQKEQRAFNFMAPVIRPVEPYPVCRNTVVLIKPSVTRTEMSIHGRRVGLENLTMEMLGGRRIVSPSEVRVTGVRNATAYEQALAEKRLAVGWGVAISCGCTGVVVRVDGVVKYLIKNRCTEHGGRKREQSPKEEWA